MEVTSLLVVEINNITHGNGCHFCKMAAMNVAMIET